MVSLRAAAACLGLTGSFSVIHNLYGYRQLKPSSVFAPRLSLLKQISVMRGKHIHLNLIRVGSELSDDKVDAVIDRALIGTREIYSTVELGVGRVEHYWISTANAQGFDLISNDREFKKLTQRWSVLNNGIDVFLVVDITGSRGKSPIGGPCPANKDRKGMTGVAVAVFAGGAPYPLLDRVLAHEIGHYLGLEHHQGVEEKGNLMHKDEFWQGLFLDSNQGSKMCQHCSVQDGCSEIE
jgi:hypothetical protein